MIVSRNAKFSGESSCSHPIAQDSWRTDIWYDVASGGCGAAEAARDALGRIPNGLEMVIPGKMRLAPPAPPPVVEEEEAVGRRLPPVPTPPPPPPPSRAERRWPELLRELRRLDGGTSCGKRGEIKEGGGGVGGAIEENFAVNRCCLGRHESGQ